MSVIERHLAGAHVSVPLKTPRSRQVGIPEAEYHPQFPIISFIERNPASPAFQRPKLSLVNAVIVPLLCQALNFKVTQQASSIGGLFVLTCVIN